MIYPAIRTAMVFGLLLGFCLGFVTSEAVAADRLTQGEVQRVVRAWDRTWDTHTEIRGIHWLKPRVARVAVRWPFADIIIEDETGRTVETAWLKEYVTVKDRADRVGLWSPVLERWEWVR